MSYHIKLKEYNCPNCNILYIPYKENMPCPSCKTILINTPKEYLGFIDELIVSLRVNKIKNNRYIPGVWYIGSFTEYVQDIIFHIFEAMDNSKLNDPKLLIDEYIDLIKSDENIKKHIHSIVMEVYFRKNELNINYWDRLLCKLS